MKKFIVCSLLIAATILLGFHQDVRAASLFGKVIEVNDGDVITIYNLNRPVKVRLLGVDAPEPGQPFAEVAKQHLKDLVLDKLVTVEYSGLGANTAIVGRVLLDRVDICAQMIRDGAAWFDVNNNSRLTDADRQIYSQSEVAARSEKRGLWQSGDAISPWEFVNAQMARRSAAASTTNSSVTKRTARPGGQLSSESLLGSAFGRTRSSDPRASLASPVAREWRHFQPAGANFSVIIPSDGFQGTETILFRDKPIDFHSHVSRDGWTMYAVMWATGPYLGETDELAITLALAGILKGLGRGYDSVGDGHVFKCDPKSQRNVSSNGYSGQEFDLTGCTMPGFARVYTKVVGDDREIIMGVSFFNQPDPNTQRFLKSFKVGL
jgi:endonuclease YncB( thermonuclease family)